MKWKYPGEAGRITTEELVGRVFIYISQDPTAEYKLYIGSDSQVHRKTTSYATAVAIHRVGKGGIYFISQHKTKGRDRIIERLIKETEESIIVVQALADAGIEDHIDHDNIEIHLDIGPNGKSREVITACIGWCEGMGYKWQIKPEASIASGLADKYVR